MRRAYMGTVEEKKGALIRADLLRDDIMNAWTQKRELNVQTAVRFMQMVDEQPEVKQEEAAWVKTGDEMAHGMLTCSGCRDCYILGEWLEDGKWNFCPNCGARMVGGDG
jgi:rRNA maturation endonuclease Nob1